MREPLKPAEPLWVAHDKRVALAIGDRDDGVVERRVNVNHALGDVLLDLLANACAAELF